VPALELDGLRKAFGDRTAVDSVGLTVAPGSFYGLVGPNGAGKTTTLSMAVGLLRPDAGSSLVFGVDVWESPQRAKAMLGVLPDGLALPEQLTGRELLSYLGQLRGLDRDTAARRAGELLDVLELGGDTERTLVINYSSGMRKKIGLATALLHAPRLLVLDEPLESVDPFSAATVKRILARFVARGGSVLLSSHVMALVEHSATRWRCWRTAPWWPRGRSTRCAAAGRSRSGSSSWSAPTWTAARAGVARLLIEMKLALLRR
jgi:ABC-2 type transport system ATP-binding protein